MTVNFGKPRYHKINDKINVTRVRRLVQNDYKRYSNARDLEYGFDATASNSYENPMAMINNENEMRKGAKEGFDKAIRPNK